MPDGAETLGGHLRERRKARGLSLQHVADRASVSLGHLSQIERGLSSPSVRELAQIAAVLDTTMGELLTTTNQHDDDTIVVRLTQRSVTDFAAGIVKQRLTPPGNDALTMFMVTLEPGGTTGDALFTHIGVETALVLQGRLRLTVAGQQFILDEGDSFRFASNTPHGFANAFAGVTRVVWVNAKMAVSAVASNQVQDS